MDKSPIIVYTVYQIHFSKGYIIVLEILFGWPSILIAIIWVVILRSIQRRWEQNTPVYDRIGKKKYQTSIELLLWWILIVVCIQIVLALRPHYLSRDQVVDCIQKVEQVQVLELKDSICDASGQYYCTTYRAVFTTTDQKRGTVFYNTQSCSVDWQ